MEQFTYQRPREKLQQRGVQFLSLTELLQLVIGSGTAHVSGSKLARRLEKLLLSGPVGYSDLLSVSGIGTAKACQVLAALEVGRRLAQGSRVPSVSKEQLSAYSSAVRAHPNTVLCVWLNGSGEEIDCKRYHPAQGEHSSMLARQLITDAVAASARTVVVLWSVKGAVAEPATNQLSFIRSLREMAQVTLIRVQGVYGVTRQACVDWSNEA